MAYRLAFAAVENAADAEEIVQMAFLQVLLKSGKDEIYNVRGWIMRMVVDTCHDKMKAEARRRRREKDAKVDRASVPGLDDEKAELGGSFQLEDADQDTFDGKVIDLNPIFREQLLLALPMYAVCDEACKGLCPECGSNLNKTQCDCAPKWEDPRLASLKSLLLKNKEN